MKEGKRNGSPVGKQTQPSESIVGSIRIFRCDRKGNAVATLTRERVLTDSSNNVVRREPLQNVRLFLTRGKGNEYFAKNGARYVAVNDGKGTLQLAGS